MCLGISGPLHSTHLHPLETPRSYYVGQNSLDISQYLSDTLPGLQQNVSVRKLEEVDRIKTGFHSTNVYRKLNSVQVSHPPTELVISAYG